MEQNLRLLKTDIRKMKPLILLVTIAFSACRTLVVQTSPQATIESTGEISGVVANDPCGFSWRRNWRKDPAIVAINDMNRPVYVIADIHGTPDKASMLQLAGIASGTLSEPRWSGGNASLVVAGDVINKGPQTLKALDLVMISERQAAAAGGRVIALFGNHEIGFLGDPFHRLFKTIHAEAATSGLDLCADLQGPQSTYGAWLRRRPIAAVVNGIFISHAGAPEHLNMAGLKQRFAQGLETEGWDSEFACGRQSDGFFNTNYWWETDEAGFKAYTEQLQVHQVLFGHDPYAFNDKHHMFGFFGDASGRALIKLDMEIFAGGNGALYRCRSFLPTGGCARHEMLERLEGGRTNGFVRLLVASTPPPQQLDRKIEGNWCFGPGDVRPVRSVP
jgi:hypothetical protein